MKVDILPWSKMRSPPTTYCYECDDLVQLVQKRPGLEGDRRCPVCGRQPGALELGISSEPDPEIVEELERMYGPRTTENKEESD